MDESLIFPDFKHSNCVFWLFHKKLYAYCICSYLRRFSKNRRALLKTCKRAETHIHEENKWKPMQKYITKTS